MNCLKLSIAFLILVPAWAYADTTSNLAGYWNFNEGSGTTINDCSTQILAGTTIAPNNTNCTGPNSGTLGDFSSGGSVFGPAYGEWTTFVNSAFWFGTNTDAYVIVPANSSLDASNALTISAWLNLTVINGNNGNGENIVNKGEYEGPDGNAGYSLIIDSNGKLELTLFNSTGIVTAVGTATLIPNNWYHVAVVFSGAAKSVTFYINGQQSGSPITTGTFTSISPASSINLNIGGVGNHLDGAIDEVRVYTRALAASDINALYTTDLANVSPITVTASYPNTAAPNTALASGTTETVLSVTTNALATCKYDTQAGVAYASMPNTFTQTGGLAHFQLLTGLSGGQSYNYFVRCMDPLGNATTTDTTVSFSIAAGNPTPVATGSNYYVAPGVISMPGDAMGGTTLNYPMSFSYAASGANGVIQPGSTVWLRGGTYSGALNLSVNGSAGSPITFRNFNRERMIYDGQGSNGIFNASGDYLQIWGLEFLDSNRAAITINPYSTFGGLNGQSITYINNISHDNGIGLGSGTMAYGNILYNNGRTGSNEEHSIYWHNDFYQINGYIKDVIDNISFNAADFGIHIYGTGSGSAGDLQGFLFDGNALIDDGFILGGGSLINADTVEHTFTFMAPSSHSSSIMEIGYAASNNIDAIFIDNYFTAADTPVYFQQSFNSLSLTYNTIIVTNKFDVNVQGVSPSDLFPVGPYNVDYNTYYYGASSGYPPFYYHLGVGGVSFAQWQSDTASLETGGFDAHSTATTATPPNQVFIRPNQYEAGRANIIVYNWNNANTVNVDLSDILTVGHSYEIHSVEDYFNDYTTGTYTGGMLSIPMNNTLVHGQSKAHTVASQLNQDVCSACANGIVSTPGMTTFPTFGTFVLIDTTVSPTAVAPVYNVLTMVQAGTGSGTVTTSPAPINCGPNCTEYNASPNFPVTLTATPALGSSFAGWTGNCTPVANNPSQCTISMSSAQTVTAIFNTGSILGDVNGDGVVNMTDAELTAQQAIGITIGGFNNSAAEVDGTGKVNIYDAYMMAKYATGQCHSLTGDCR